MRIFPGGGSGSVRRGGLRRAIGTPAAVAGLIGAVGLAVWLGGLAGPVSAAVTPTCQWNGSVSTDLTVADNWTLTSVSGTCGTGSGTGTASLSGAQLVFPASVPGSRSALSFGGTPESPDDLVFNNTYTIGGSGTLTLSGTANSGVGLAVTAGSPVISAPVALAASQTFDAANGAGLDLTGVISGASADALTVGDASDTGTVTLSGANTYYGATTVSGAQLYLDSSGALGNTSGVTVEDNGTLSLNTAGVNYAEPLTLGSVGGAGTLQVGSNGPQTCTWSGPVSLVPTGTTDVFYTSNGPLTVTGVISGGGNLMADGGSTLTLDAMNTYTGTTEVASTVADGVDNALPTGTALDVVATATFDMAGRSQSVAGFSGAGTVLDSASSTTSTLTDTAGATTFSGVLENNSGTGGTVALTVSGANLALSGTNTYSGATTVSSGTLATTSSSGFGISTVSVAAAATLELSGGSVQPSNTLDLTGTLKDVSGNDGWNGPIVLAASASPQIANPGGGGGDFVVVGAITGGAGSTLTFSATGSIDLGSNSYTANTAVT
ncbi:MAG: beta strand repeat-containing protein, partial [Candidatus Dormibacteria bacterium]